MSEMEPGTPATPVAPEPAAPAEPVPPPPAAVEDVEGLNRALIAELRRWQELEAAIRCV